MKRILTTCILLTVLTTIYSQNPHLDVEGHSRIIGNLDVHHMEDSTTTYIGYEAGGNSNFVFALKNTAIGYQSLSLNLQGDNNTAMGYKSLSSNTFGWQNTAIGNESLALNKFGIANTGVGYNSLKSNINGNTNTAVGAWSLWLSTGSSNTAVGSHSLESSTTASFNTAVGDSSLCTNTTGVQNTAVGSKALLFTSGDHNTAIGFHSLFNNTGHRNTVVGHGAGKESVIGDGNVFIGYNAGKNESGSNQLIIENSDADSTNVLIYGEFDNDLLRINGLLNLTQTTSNSLSGIRIDHPSSGFFWNTWVDVLNDYNFSHNGALTAWISSVGGMYNMSDEKLKSNIHKIDDVLPKVILLSPSNYYFKNDKERKSKSYGFIAQDVQKLFPDFVSEKDGYLGVGYDNFIPVLAKAIQEQQETINKIHSENEALKQDNEVLKQDSATLKLRLDKLEEMVRQLKDD